MANTYKILASTTVGAGGTSTITFNDIPATYTDLIIKISARTTYTAGSYGDGFIMTFNGDTYANNYSNRWLQAYDSNADTNFNNASNNTGLIPDDAAAQTANVFSNTELQIWRYANNTTPKTWQNQVVVEKDGNTAWVLQQYIGTWNSTEAITSISLASTTASTIKQYTTVTLYGVFNADVSSAPSAPTIGTATAASTGAYVAFTGVNNAASYKITSSPGSITAVGTTSPIYVSGLTGGTTYTFTAQAQNPFGISSASASSNSIIPSASGWENLGSYTGTTPTVTFSSIPTTYKHLVILMNIRTSQTGGVAEEGIWMRLNDVAGTNYGYVGISSNDTNNVNGTLTTSADAWYAISSPSSTTAADFAAPTVIYIYDYANTNMRKSVNSYTGWYDQTNGYFRAHYAGGAVNTTSAVTTIRLQSGNFRNWASGSRISLYGIRG